MLKKLKSLFVIEEESPEEMLEKRVNNKKKSDNPKPAKAVGNPSSKTDSPKRKPVTTREGKPSQRFLDALLKAMDENNLDGFDYLEFKESLKSLSSMSMDEATRYKSAFAMASTMGASSDMLKKTAQHYVDVLNQEEKKFKQALINQRHRKIHDKEEEIKRLKMAIASHEEQIEKLSNEIGTFKQKMGEFQTDLTAAESKLETTKNDFLVTYGKLVDQIQQDIDKMNQYLE